MRNLIVSPSNVYLIILFVLQRLVTYDPSKRISAMEALKHRYFEDVKLQPPPLSPS